MIANALPRPLTAGSVDNAILRADGTGGSTLQSSGLIVDDAVVPYSVTGDAATDVITATGHIYTANQTVIFSAITGGAGLAANTVYFVRDISGSTFKLAATSGGAAINFTTNITAGTVIAIQANVTVSQNTTETNSALVLSPKGTGALLAQKPDGTVTGGNARGSRAVDLQLSRSSAAAVASGNSSFVAGENNTVSTASGMAIGSGNSVTGATGSGAFGTSNTSSGGSFPSFAFGTNCTASGSSSFAAGRSSSAGSYAASFGGFCNASGDGSLSVGNNSVSSGINSQAMGQSCTANTIYSTAIGEYALANRRGMVASCAGTFSGTSSGDAQRASFVLRNKTTTNSAVELFLDGSSTRLTIPSGKVLGLTINITGISSTGAAVAHYLRQYALKNVSGTTSEVYAPVTIGTDNAAGTSIALSASDASDALVVSVTGTASTIWRWVASVDAVEIAFGI
jgi:hypothetical protein